MLKGIYIQTVFLASSSALSCQLCPLWLHYMRKPMKGMDCMQMIKEVWPPFHGTPGSETRKHCRGIPSSNAPGFITRLARAGALAHVPCSHTLPALLLQAMRWLQGKVPAPHPANGVTSSRRFGKARQDKYPHRRRHIALHARKPIRPILQQNSRFEGSRVPGKQCYGGAKHATSNCMEFVIYQKATISELTICAHQ
jgi:hypothetical protein